MNHETQEKRHAIIDGPGWSELKTSATVNGRPDHGLVLDLVHFITNAVEGVPPISVGVGIQTLNRHGGSNTEWMFEGVSFGKVKGFYNTDSRQGWMVFLPD